VERTLMIHVGDVSGGDSAGGSPEAELARRLGAREVRIVPVPLAKTEGQQLAALTEQMWRESIS